MATTVPGGRYLDARGNWKDANGNPLDPPSSAEEKGDPEPTPLPENFPARDLLIEAGFETVEAVTGAEDDELLEVDGIGPARLEEIRAATADA